MVVVYAFQLLAELPIDGHDLAGDVVVTDEGAVDLRGVLAG